MSAIRYGVVWVVVAAPLGWMGSASVAPPTKAQVCEAAKVTAAGNKQDCLAIARSTCSPKGVRSSSSGSRAGALRGRAWVPAPRPDCDRGLDR